MKRALVLLVTALTPKLLRSGAMPRLEAYARTRLLRPLLPDLPAVTCTVQASMLTGAPPSVHGAVANGWYFRSLGEVWLWRQSSRLLHGPTLHERWREAFPGSRTAQLFWWWNLPSRADLAVTPRPAYCADGRKLPDVHSRPAALRRRLNERLGFFPLFRFWGPGAGIESTRWIVSATLDVLREERPALTLAYLPHLDYDLQRYGPGGPEARRAAAEVDLEAGRLLDHAHEEGIAVLVLSEYGIAPVRRPCLPNLALRRAGLLAVHAARNGALLDPGASRAFAVCDHQCAHVYVAEPRDLPRTREVLEGLEGVAEVHDASTLPGLGLDHPRSGELFLLAEPDAWFAWPYWDEAVGDRQPDFARTVDIHRKPGYDPCELFLDPALRWPRLQIAWRLLRQRLGMRAVMDLVPLDPKLVRGSHGRLPASPEDGPVWIGPEELAPPQQVVPAAAALDGLLPTP